MLLRGGRLGDISEEVLEYISSREADRWIVAADLAVDRAHVIMLREKRILSEEVSKAILDALDELQTRGLEALGEGEDIHEAIEAYVISRVGVEGGRMHTGRSRNDEVATCIRLALREQMLGMMKEVLELQEVLLLRASEGVNTIIPGYTHLQHAQPTTLAHHLLAHSDALNRDLQRLEEAYERVNLSPLGAAAFASTGFEIDRYRTCQLLGFKGLVENSMDAVSSRDFLLEVLSTMAILMIDLSRLGEEIILWSTSEFGYLELDDLFASTSSIMPQKKNPDTAELLRAKCASVIGALTAALAINKALPMSYNRDLQEMTPHLWRSVTWTRSSLSVMRGIIHSLRFHEGRLSKSAGSGFSTATELADSLVRRTGMPFRTAHSIVGRLACSDQMPDMELLDRVGMEVAGFRPSERGFTGTDLAQSLDPVQNVRIRDRPGGPAPEEMTRILQTRRKELEMGLTRFFQKAKACETALAALMDLK